MRLTRIGFSNVLFFVDLNLFVWTLFIDLNDMLLSLVEQLTSNIFHVSGLRPLSDAFSNLRVFWENVVLQK